VEIVGLSVMARGVPEHPRLPDRVPPAATPVPARRHAWFPDAGWIDMPVTDRAGLAKEPRSGPLNIQEYDATCLVPRGWRAEVDAFGNVQMTI
jgi:N-methylhydantoinase A